MGIPPALSRCFADSRVQIQSFCGDGDRLILRLEKEIDLEVGRITFHSVSFISLRTCFPGDGMSRSWPVSELPVEMAMKFAIDRRDFDSDDVAFEIVNQDGPVHLVIAKSIHYEIVSRLGAKLPPPSSP